MAQRATGFAKRTPARTNRVGHSVRAVAEATVGLRAIPLELGPLLAPYRKNGRVSLRIERLPQLACLSRGRNKGGGSWSLTPDELDDLVYLLPEGIDEAHTLAMRVIDLDADAGSTLAVLDFLVSPGAAEPGGAPEEAPIHGAEDARDDAPPKPNIETDLADARERWQRDAQDALLKAEQGWKADEAKRLAAAEAQWRERSATNLAAVTARCEQAEAALLAARARADAHAATAREQTDEEVCRLRDERAALRAALGNRESELAQMRLAAERARENWRQESAAALSNAQAAWKTDMAARLAAAEARGREQAASALTEATARAEAAETALAQVRRATQAARERSDNAEIRRLQHEREALQTALAERETELAHIHSAAEQARELAAPEDKIVLRTNRAWEAVDRRERPPTRLSRRAIGGVVLAVGLAAIAISVIPSIFGERRAPAASTVLRPIVRQHMAVVAHDANVRAGPSTASVVVSRVPRGLEVATIEQRGDWILVQIAAANGKAPRRQGWVHSSLLKDADGGDAKPPSIPPSHPRTE